MRVYRLHDQAWTRIVTHRVRRPNVVAARLRSRRRRAQAIPVDGRLVLLDGDHGCDPRTGEPVGRRELLDRLIEALSVPGVDGVVGPADLLEELTVLNVLEHRLAICAGPTPTTAVVAGGFDAAAVSVDGDRPGLAAERVAALHERGVPTLIDLRVPRSDGGSAYDVDWQQWTEPLRAVASSISTGPGVWFTLPAIVGLDPLAEQIGFPLLVRDTEVPIDPAAWVAWFERELPLNVRGIVAGASALFPMEGSVADASARIVAAVRPRAP